MRPRVGLVTVLFLALLTSPLATPLAADAQQAGKVYRIGVLSPGDEPHPYLPAFLGGLRDLGWVEGRNVIIERRWAKGRIERLPALAADLVQLGVDVILASGPPGVRAAMNATRSIPIVFVLVGDPVASGFVDNVARPGRNASGLSDIAPEVTGKLLELLKETAPGVSRLAVVWVPTHPVHAVIREQTRTAASALRIELQWLGMPDVRAFSPTFSAMKRERADALSSTTSPVRLGRLYDDAADVRPSIG